MTEPENKGGSEPAGMDITQEDWDEIEKMEAEDHKANEAKNAAAWAQACRAQELLAVAEKALEEKEEECRQLESTINFVEISNNDLCGKVRSLVDSMEKMRTTRPRCPVCDMNVLEVSTTGQWVLWCPRCRREFYLVDVK